MSVFDGMAGVLGDALGTSVMHLPVQGQSSSIQAVFREGPVRVLDEDGGFVLTTFPSLKVQEPLAASLQRKDRIDPGNGKIYEILNSQPSGSPASDAFVIFELEEVLS